MNEESHNILDGEEGGDTNALSPEEQASLAEHRRLQSALRENATHGGLSAAEKATIGGALAGTIGTTSSGGGGGSWIGIAGAFLLGAVLGAGLLFLLTDREKQEVAATPTGIIVEAEATTPALFPYTLPEPTAAEECADRVSDLRDSIQVLQSPKPVKKKRYRKRRTPPVEPPTTGGAVPQN